MRSLHMSLFAKVRLACLLGLVLTLLVPANARSVAVLRAALLGGSLTGATWVGPARHRLTSDPGSQLRRHVGPDPAGAGNTAQLRRLVVDALNRQSEALQANDLAAFLAITAPGAQQLRDALSRRFASLRAMQVVTWDPSLAAGFAENGAGRWSVPVRLRYCFVVAGCAAATITVSTGWSYTNGQALLVAFETSGANQTGPRPWEVSELQAVVGSRVLVASTGRWVSRLASVLKAAERAAAVTDRYARWDEAPKRYVVYVAGPDEWSHWYGVTQGSWVAAYAIALTDTYTEIVLNATKVGVLDVSEVLQHEFTHVVTLSGMIATRPDTWWLVEGLAEYVQNQGRSLAEYRAFTDGRRYASHGWNGSVALGEPDPSASLSEANGRYAVVYLTVWRLVERYGEHRMLDFFAAVARNGMSVDAAAPATLGQSWARVSGDCAAYVRLYLGSPGLRGPGMR